MIQFNPYAVNWAKWLPYVAIILLAIIVLSTCNNEAHTQLANKSLKKDLKISDLKAQKYADRINVLYDSLTILERTKQKEIVKIKVVVKEVEAKIQSVGSLKTKGIANFYQNRYKLPVTITQYGVALTDTIAKKNIIELIQKDGLVQELQSTQNILSISDKSNNVKDSIISNKSLIIVEKDNQLKTHSEIEKNLTKSVKSEKVKKNIWKVVAGSIFAGSVYLLAK